jgi:uncharacterized protein YyaL (SSP411 family)
MTNLPLTRQMLLRAAPTKPRDASGDGSARRAAELARLLASDARLSVGGRRGAGLSEEQAAAEAIAWLVRSHDVTGRRGSSRGYSLLSGWAPAFPETTGYLIGTLLAYARLRGRDDLVSHAEAMADWELEVQGADGGIRQGLITTRPIRSIAFNTGMVMHGWLDLHAASGDERYLSAAREGGRFLVDSQQPDGTWIGPHSYRGIPHTYKSRVAWALLKLAQASGEPAPREAAIRTLDWVVSVQRPNGWFEHCAFEPGALANSHGIAYTIRGLVESAVLLGEERHLGSAVRASVPLIDRFTADRTLASTWRPDWTPASRSVCLTGLAQLGGAWLRIHEVTGNGRFRRAGDAAVAEARRHQLAGSNPNTRGALPGSFPIFGRYTPFAFPNWATKFLVDALLIRARVSAGVGGSEWAWG